MSLAGTGGHTVLNVHVLESALGHEEISIIPACGVFAAPPGTPREFVAVLERALSQTTSNREFTKLADTMGTYVDFLPSVALRNVTAEQDSLVNTDKQFMK